MQRDNAKKIQARKALRAVIARLKKQNKRVVFTNGCFDLLHLGHILLFRKAKASGDILVVGINSDNSVHRLKGPRRPVVGERARARVIAELASVDYVTIFDEDTPYELIRELRPDVLVKGDDYRLNEIVGRDLVQKVVRFPLVEGYSTSELISKILRAYGKKTEC